MYEDENGDMYVRLFDACTKCFEKKDDEAYYRLMHELDKWKLVKSYHFSDKETILSQGKVYYFKYLTYIKEKDYID